MCFRSRHAKGPMLMYGSEKRAGVQLIINSSFEHA